jgi:hypothetical protein
MRQVAIGIALAAALAACPGARVLAQATGPTVEVADGNIHVEQAGRRRQITSTGLDSEPILSPDGTVVIFTRLGAPPKPDADERDPGTCVTPTDELRRIRIDGTGDELLLKGRSGTKPEEQLCEFSRKQFASDGRTLYFLSPAWATSAALHLFDTRAKSLRFVAAANDVLVLGGCTGELRDHLVLQQHRYFVFGGSFDWYWLFDPAGKKELGPIGEAENTETIQLQIEDSGRCK